MGTSCPSKSNTYDAPHRPNARLSEILAYAEECQVIKVPELHSRDLLVHDWERYFQFHHRYRMHLGNVWKRKPVECTGNLNPPKDKPTREINDKNKRPITNAIFVGWILGM
nr:uncharacterized protein LOC109183154 [Ipomoea trifida]